MYCERDLFVGFCNIVLSSVFIEVDGYGVLSRVSVQHWRRLCKQTRVQRKIFHAQCS